MLVRRGQATLQLRLRLPAAHERAQAKAEQERRDQAENNENHRKGIASQARRRQAPCEADCRSETQHDPECERQVTPHERLQTNAPLRHLVLRADNPMLTASNVRRSEEHTSELQSLTNLVCRLL